MHLIPASAAFVCTRLLCQQLYFGMLYPYFKNKTERGVIYDKGDVWDHERMPHPNVLVFPGICGGLVHNTTPRPIVAAFDFYLVSTTTAPQIFERTQ